MHKRSQSFFYDRDLNYTVYTPAYCGLPTIRPYHNASFIKIRKILSEINISNTPYTYIITCAFYYTYYIYKYICFLINNKRTTNARIINTRERTIKILKFIAQTR